MRCLLLMIRSQGIRTRTLLPHSRHLTALGKIVDTVLSRILEDITKLPDITADESHRLSELCRMPNALEGLFAEGPEQVSSRLFSSLQASIDDAG